MTRTGFTLIEIIVVMGIIAILAGFGYPMYSAVRASASMVATTESVEQAVRQAHGYAMAMKNGAPWGTYVGAGTVVVFSGATYASRDTSKDVTYVLDSGLVVSGTTEYDFAAVTGRPTSAGSTTLTIVNSSKSFTVNALGIIQ